MREKDPKVPGSLETGLLGLCKVGLGLVSSSIPGVLTIRRGPRYLLST